jgi:hypothetical protein
MKTHPKLARLLDSIMELLKSYVVFPGEDAEIVKPLWIAHAWVLDAFDFTPYLQIYSPVRMCGKSRLFDCLRYLCPKPWYTIQPTEAVLFRKLQAHCPTLLLDEIDTVFTDKTDPNKEGIRAVLNAGFERGAVVRRCHGANFELKDSLIFGAKAFAGIGNIPVTIGSRSIKIPMRRRRKDEEVKRLRKRELKAAAEPFGKALEAWRNDKNVIADLCAARPEMPDGLDDRAEDICEPLFAIAEMAGGHWPLDGRAAVLVLKSNSDTDNEDRTIQLLLAIREIFQNWTDDHISSRDLLHQLIEQDGGPWAAWWQNDIDNGNIRGPAARLAKLLRPFGILPRTITRDDGSTPKGYPKRRLMKPLTVI